VLLYTTVSGTVAIYTVALLFGFTIGNVYRMMSLLTAEIFGIVSFGTVYGVVSPAGQLGSGLGLVFMGWARDATDGYTIPFIVLAALNLVAAMIITFACPVHSVSSTLPTAVEVEVEHPERPSMSSDAPGLSRPKPAVEVGTEWTERRSNGVGGEPARSAASRQLAELDSARPIRVARRRIAERITGGLGHSPLWGCLGSRDVAGRARRREQVVRRPPRPGRHRPERRSR
jgi:hypothetical protein